MTTAEQIADRFDHGQNWLDAEGIELAAAILDTRRAEGNYANYPDERDNDRERWSFADGSALILTECWDIAAHAGACFCMAGEPDPECYAAADGEATTAPSLPTRSRALATNPGER